MWVNYSWVEVPRPKRRLLRASREWRKRLTRQQIADKQQGQYPFLRTDAGSFEEAMQERRQTLVLLAQPEEPEYECFPKPRYPRPYTD